MVDRVKKNPHIEVIYDSAVEEIQGEKWVDKVQLKNLKTGAI